MEKAILEEFRKADCLIMAAAVSDWRPEKRYFGKLKIKERWDLRLVPTPDILKEVSKLKRDSQIVIGFALETENMEDNALKKLREKKLDLIVANTPSFFGDGASDVIFISKSGEVKKFENIGKEKVAELIVKWIENNLTK